MKKLIVLLSILVLYVSCSSTNTCYLNEQEALDFVNPIIKSIIKYKNENGVYPKDLTKIRYFPYKIEKYPNKDSYYFVDKENLYMESRRLNNSKLYFQVDFLGCNSPKSVTGINIEFKKNGSYKIHYYKLPPALKQ